MRKVSRALLIEREKHVRGVDVAFRQNHNVDGAGMRDSADQISQRLPIDIPE
jgi:hypothetical protein